jgi:hypothetical protein
MWRWPLRPRGVRLAALADRESPHGSVRGRDLPPRLRSRPGLHARRPRSCDSHSDDLSDFGGMVAAYALTPRAMAMSLRGGAVTSGPFLEAMGIVAGFYVIEAPDLDAAVAIARTNPAGWNGGGAELHFLCGMADRSKASVQGGDSAISSTFWSRSRRSVSYGSWCGSSSESVIRRARRSPLGPTSARPPRPTTGTLTRPLLRLLSSNPATSARSGPQCVHARTRSEVTRPGSPRPCFLPRMVRAAPGRRFEQGFDIRLWPEWLDGHLPDQTHAREPPPSSPVRQRKRASSPRHRSGTDRLRPRRPGRNANGESRQFGLHMNN